MIEHIAPDSSSVIDYDRSNLLIYAELLDADADCLDWEIGVVTILEFIAPFNRDAARRCCETHLDRARWITGEGLPGALEAFGSNPLC